MQPPSPPGTMAPAPPLPPSRKGHQTSSVPAAGKGSVRAQTNLFPLPLRLQQYQVVKCLLSEGPSDLRNVTRSGARRLLPSARREACPGDGAAAGRSEL